MLIRSCSIWTGSTGTAMAGPGSTATARRRSSPALRRTRSPTSTLVDLRRRQLRQLRVGGGETAQGVGAGGDDRQTTPHVVLVLGQQRVAADERLEAPGNRLDRRERVVDFVPDDPDEALPGLAFFVAKRPAHVGEHDELVRTSLLPKRRPPNLPPAGAARERDVLDAWRRTLETTLEPDLVGRAIEQTIGRYTKQPFTRAVDEPKRSSGVECEDRHIDLEHDGPQERSCFDGAEALIVECRGQVVDLGHDGGQRIALSRGRSRRAPRADREIALSHRGQQIGQRLQRHGDTVPHEQGTANPRGDHQDADGPLNAAWFVRVPEHHEQRSHTGEAGGQRQPQDAVIEPHASQIADGTTQISRAPVAIPDLRCSAITVCGAGAGGRGHCG